MRRISDNVFAKLAIILFAAVLVVSAAMCLIPDEPVTWTTYVVHEGDTLWEIARKCSEEGEDTRKALKLIKNENGLKDSHIEVGQLLYVPEAE